MMCVRLELYGCKQGKYIWIYKLDKESIHSVHFKLGFYIGHGKYFVYLLSVYTFSNTLGLGIFCEGIFCFKIILDFVGSAG